MKPPSKAQGKRQTKRVGNVLGDAKRLVAALHGLLWVAKHPQDNRGKTQTAHARVLSVEQRMGAVLLTVVERYTLFQMGTGSDKLAKPVQCIAQCSMTLEDERRVVLSLR